jgi:hypothetical protein
MGYAFVEAPGSRHRVAASFNNGPVLVRAVVALIDAAGGEIDIVMPDLEVGDRFIVGEFDRATMRIRMHLGSQADFHRDTGYGRTSRPCCKTHAAGEPK